MSIKTGSLSISSEKRSLNALGLVAICFGFFMVILDTSIVNVALPAIQHNLHGTLEGLQWVVNGYTLIFASLLLSAGMLGDRFGHKRTFLAGYILFTGASLLCSFAPSLRILILARVLQGVGPALLVPGSLSLIAHGIEDAGQRAKAVSIWAGCSGIGLAGGPVVGGLLVETLGWRSIFLLNVPCGLLAILLTLHFVSETPHTVQHKLDIWGQVCIVIALATLTYLLIEGRDEGWATPQVIGIALLCICTSVGFLLIERRTVSPLLPLSFFSRISFTVPIVVGGIINFGLYGLLFAFSLFFQYIHHYSAVLTGVVLLPMTVATGSAALMSGRVMTRFDVHWPMIAGLAAGTLGTLFLLLGAMCNNVFLLTCGEIIVGLGCGITVPAMTTMILHAVPTSQVGVTSALLNAGRQIGGVLGIAIVGTILGSLSERNTFLAGMPIALVLIVLAFLLGCILVVITWQQSRKERATN